MPKRQDWFSANERLISPMEDLINHDLRVNLIAMSRISSSSTQQKGASKPERRVKECPESVPEERLWLMKATLAVLLVREAERCNVPLPEPGEFLGDWLDKTFLPAYKTAFLKEP